MKAYWHYRCDFGHSWTLLKELDSSERPDESVCPYGHEAVTLQKAVVADLVQVALRPAGEIDSVTGRLRLEKRYYVVLMGIQRPAERMSRKNYLWEEAIRIINGFRGLTPEQGWRLLDSIDAQQGNYENAKSDPD